MSTFISFHLNHHQGFPLGGNLIYLVHQLVHHAIIRHIYCHCRLPGPERDATLSSVSLVPDMETAYLVTLNLTDCISHTDPVPCLHQPGVWYTTITCVHHYAH